MNYLPNQTLFFLDALGEPTISISYGKWSQKYVKERLSSAKKRLIDAAANEFDLDPSSLDRTEDDCKDVIKVDFYILQINHSLKKNLFKALKHYL